ncbi:NUDIX hydrolase [Lysinibacillus louembei]|uniref:NUDIX hydrolase n=1 Tax=Lysinibacillus louembei TaxID=1470088 RepID=A0ABZ0S102_9BACI|nr:NUDIX hydrolase [Lysinibacillus louembei]WPK12936.1 NUDIX hydrolase [Lysinibacillus louembei]
MDTELLKVFDHHGKHTGIATREEVHSKGLWHETFHCWFISKEEDKHFLHFQMRCAEKKDYSNLLDITAAGYINAEENVADGIREVHEELGIDLALEDLIYIGCIQDEIIQDIIIDRELAHIFFYNIPNPLNYTFQMEEVVGIMKVELALFEQLWFGKIENICATGIVVDKKLRQVEVDRRVAKGDFLPHTNAYISNVLMELKKIIE